MEILFDWLINALATLCEVSADAGKVAAATPIFHLLLVVLSAGAHGVGLWGDWNVWFHFQQDGFSDSPLIPASTPWMFGWLAFTIVRSDVALLEFSVGLLGVCNATYMYCTKDRVKRIHVSADHEAKVGRSYRIRHYLLWIEEVLGVFGVAFDFLLLLLGVFYYVVQSDCKDLNGSEKVLISVGLTTLGLVWQVLKFLFLFLRHFGCCCCKKKDTLDDIIPVLVTNFGCKIILQPILLAGGIALFVLIIILRNDTESFDRSTIHIMRNNSDNFTTLFSIADMTLNGSDHGNLTIMEQHPNPDSGGMINCLATFRHDPDSREFFYNVAYVQFNVSSSEYGICTCISNHEKCKVHYDDLYYGYSYNGKPYECYNRASLVGINKENSPTHDEEGEVYCVCKDPS